MTDSQNSQISSQTGKDQPMIRWDDAGIRNSYANTCTVSSTKEEVVLNFGLNQAWERPQQEVQVQLTNRIILNPYTAKRLALLLGAVVQQYEKQYGVLELGTVRSQTNQAENKPHAVK